MTIVKMLPGEMTQTVRYTGIRPIRYHCDIGTFTLDYYRAFACKFMLIKRTCTPVIAPDDVITLRMSYFILILFFCGGGLVWGRGPSRRTATVSQLE